jgi:2-C-methyl-D-erythritol 4-phosphate cytidylyltransferase
MVVAALLLAAGSGTRLGAGIPKALVAVNGRSLLEWSLRSLDAHDDVDVIAVVAPASEAATITSKVSDRAQVVTGGATRQASVELGLAVLDSNVDLVLVHDSARAFVSARVITDVVAALRRGAEAVVPVLPVVDTIKRVDVHGVVTATMDRTDLRIVQTPQGFRRDVLEIAHASALARGTTDSSDDAGLLEAIGRLVHTVPGSANAFKITTPHDLRVAEALMTP